MELLPNQIPDARCSPVRKGFQGGAYLFEGLASPVRCDLHQRRNLERFAAETTPVPLLTLFAPKAWLGSEALNSNNVRGGTCLAEAVGAKKGGRVLLAPPHRYAGD